MRRDHRGWGPSRVRWELERAGVAPLAGRSVVCRALVRRGLVGARKRRRRREGYRRWERGRAMQLWQMEVMGRVHLASGDEVKVVTGIDDHSWLFVCATVVAAAAARPVCQALARALGRHGIPEQILTDNSPLADRSITPDDSAAAPAPQAAAAAAAQARRPAGVSRWVSSCPRTANSSASTRSATTAPASSARSPTPKAAPAARTPPSATSASTRDCSARCRPGTRTPRPGCRPGTGTPTSPGYRNLTGSFVPRLCTGPGLVQRIPARHRVPPGGPQR
jgi:hypothetical protein